MTNLSEDFWRSRPALEHIQAAARSRLVAPDAVLGVTLVRASLLVPPSVLLPPTIGGASPLNLVVANVGPASAGKSGAKRVAADLVEVNRRDTRADRPLGSGEGLVDTYLGPAPDKDEPRPLSYPRCSFHADEGQVLGKMSRRDGATLLEVVRSAWSGEELGQTNAEAARRRRIPALAYRFGLVANFQPIHAADLLADVHGGTPQRFLWLSAVDPNIPDTRPSWPGELFLGFDEPTDGVRYLTIADSITSAIEEEHRARHRAGLVDTTDDGHDNLTRLRVAAMLAALEKRLDVDPTDWQLAGAVMSTSRSVRTYCTEVARLDQKRRDQRRLEMTAAGAEASDRAVHRAQLDRQVGVIARKVWREHPATVSRNDLRRAMDSRHRHHFDDAVDTAVERHYVEREPEPDTFVRGDVRPPAAS